MSIRDLITLHYKNNLGHMSSTLTAYPIIKKIYEKMGENDVFILSQGHAGLALYAVLGEGRSGEAQRLLDKHGIHPHRDIADGIYCTTGSLGQGITVAVGIAMGKGERGEVHVLISDGECAEGAVMEALSYIERTNLPITVHINVNGMTAMGEELPVSRLVLDHYRKTILWEAEELPPPFTNTIKDHYFSLTEEQYKELMSNYSSKSGCFKGEHDA